MDPGGLNPFADLMSKAVKLKGAQQAQLRTQFDAWPQYFQHSLFMQDSVLSVRPTPFSERFAAAETMKASGNQHFKQGDFEEAVAEYEKALAVFKYIENKDPGWKKKGIEDTDLVVVDYNCHAHPDDQPKLDALKLSCYLNIAVSKFKLREFAICVRACDDALEVDATSVKALFRRAQALITPVSSGALELDRAIQDLQRAFDLEPDNREVRKLLRELKEQRVRQRSLDKQTFSGMFDRGQVYDEDKASSPESNQDDEQDEAQREAKFQREIEDANRIAHAFERKGQSEHAAEIRGRVAQATEAHARRLKRVDFFHPSAEMIQNAKENGIDLTDRNVQQMLHDMQEEEHCKASGQPDSATSKGSAASPSPQNRAALNETVDSLLKSMSNNELADLLRSAGIDYHTITDREQFYETARQVLLAKLDTAQRDGPASGTAPKSYTRTVMLLACAWTLMRLYSSGGLGALGRLLLKALGGASDDSAAPNTTDELSDSDLLT